MGYDNRSAFINLQKKFQNKPKKGLTISLHMVIDFKAKINSHFRAKRRFEKDFLFLTTNFHKSGLRPDPQGPAGPRTPPFGFACSASPYAAFG